MQKQNKCLNNIFPVSHILERLIPVFTLLEVIWDSGSETCSGILGQGVKRLKVGETHT